KGRGRQTPANHFAVGEHELTRRVRFDAELLQDPTRNQGVHGSGVDETMALRGAMAVGRIAHLDLDERQPHGTDAIVLERYDTLARTIVMSSYCLAPATNSSAAAKMRGTASLAQPFRRDA